MALACVYIPVQNSEEETRFALDQLKAEQAPLHLWLIITVAPSSTISRRRQPLLKSDDEPSQRQSSAIREKSADICYVLY